MKTKIRLAGDKWQQLVANGDEGKVIWTGDMDLVMTLGMRVVDESEDEVKLYQISQVAVHFNKEELWQTLFVIPKKS